VGPESIELLTEHIRLEESLIRGEELLQLLALRSTHRLPAACYVFGTQTGDRRKSFRGSWNATREGAKIPKDEAGRFTLTFHDLRREFGSRLLESDATLAEVQAALGHTSVVMTARYLGVTDVGLQKSFARFERHQKAAVLASRKSGVS
jgi:integrase